MKRNREFVDAFLDGDAALPGTFTTGFRRDLQLAREIIQQRRIRREHPDDKLPDEFLKAASR